LMTIRMPMPTASMTATAASTSTIFRSRMLPFYGAASHMCE
jgi:hypothetical protein